MLVTVVRTLILYMLVIVSMRIMGKRQVGELQPSELVVAIMISDLAAVPMQGIEIPLLSGMVPVITLVIAEVLVSFLSLKSNSARHIIAGKPSMIIRNGKINEAELRKLRFNLNDLSEQLRIAGYPSISEVYTAVLETNGQLSVIPKNAVRPLTPQDVGIKISDEELPFMIIADGTLNENELRRANKTQRWLEKKLTEHKITEIKEVFVLEYRSDGSCYVQKKEKYES